jgi:hypothetical protein
VKHSPLLEANICLGGEEISRLLFNPYSHYHIHKSQINPHYTTIFFRIHFNISEVNFSLQLLQPKFCMHFSRPMHISRLAQPILLYNNIWRLVQLKEKLLIMRLSPFS